MKKINSILKNLKKKYQQEYGVAVFDVKIKNVKGKIEITGKVLTGSQKDDILKEVFRQAQDNKTKTKKVNLKILSDVDERSEIGWAVVKTKIADLKFRFVSNRIINNKILKRIRCSQAFQGEILRILFKKDDQLLVQQNDLTLGWVKRNELILKRKSLYKDWKKGREYALKNKILNLNNCHYELVSESSELLSFSKNEHADSNYKYCQDEVLKEVEKFLDVKYVLGGKSKEGIDCSGLTQVAYKNALGIILPKHSWDQKKMGKKVSFKNAKSGDLIFLIKKTNQHRHVGIVEKNKEKINLIHASLDKNKVVKQKLSEVFKSHDFVEARRIFE